LDLKMLRALKKDYYMLALKKEKALLDYFLY